MKYKQPKAETIKINDACRQEKSDCTQDLIEIQAIAEDGIFLVHEGLYSKCYTFNDINYDILSDAEQSRIIVKFMKLLQKLNTRFKITYINSEVDYDDFKKTIMLPLKNDEYDKWRIEVNEIMGKRMQEGRQGVLCSQYFTISVKRKTYEEAKGYFLSLEKELQKDLHGLGSSLQILDCQDRMKILYDFYRFGEPVNVPFHFDFSSLIENARDFLDDIAPGRIVFHSDHFELNGGVGRILYVRTFPTDLTDRFVQKLLDLPYPMLISVDGEPITRKASTDLINSKYMIVQNKIRKQQQIRNRNKDYSSEISLPVQEEAKDVKTIANAVKEGNQSVLYCGVTICMLGSDLQQLDERTSALIRVATGETVTLDAAANQRQGINTVLPIGIRQCTKMRTMLSGGMTAFLPFATQELMIPDGQYYGINQMSKNIVKANRRSLRNGNAFIFGVPGSGKSMDAKLEAVIMKLQHPEVEMIFIDPNAEFQPVVDMFHGTTIDVRPGSKTYINGFAFPPDMPKDEIVPSKTAWMISIHVQCRQDDLSASEKTKVDEALQILYEPWISGKASPNMPPDMIQYHQVLLDMNTEITKNLAEELAYFTSGSLNMFAHQTNVDISKQVISYNIRDISKDLMPIAFSTIMESIRLRVYDNFNRGIGTWIVVDEVHRLTKDDLSAEYLDMIFREFRKFYGFCTGLSHQVDDVCRSEFSKELVRNSAFLWLFGQEDVRSLSELGFSDAQLDYVLNAEPGTGILKHGKIIIPVDNRIPVDSDLYRLLNTDPDRNSKRKVG